MSKTQKKQSKKNQLQHQRVNDILLGPLEKRILAWFIFRMPGWVTPDMLTFLGFFAGILIAISYCLCRVNINFLWLASFGFFLNWFGDSLDGNLARSRGIERPKYGFFIDHIIDAFSQSIIFFGLGLSPFVNFEYALLCLIGYLLMDILVYVSTYVTGTFRISYGKIGPTEARALAIVINTIVYFTNNASLNLPWIGNLSIFNVFVLLVAIIFVCMFIINSVTQAITLAKEDNRQ